MTMSSSPRRLLSVWLRRLATDRIERGSPSPAPAETPLAIAAPVKSARRITALNDAAAKLGLRVGMALADARAMHPALATADAEPQADLALLAAIADWCARYTPLVGLNPPDGLLLDISGCAHLFGGETELCRDLSRRLRVQGFHVCVAAADTVGAAWAVARYGSPGVVPRGATRGAITPLPLGALRIDPDIVEALAQAGLKRVEHILDLPRAPLAARFGENLIRRLDQALGREEESIVPRLPLPSYLVEQRFPEPIAREEDVLGTIRHLASELARVLERRGAGARRLQAALFRTDGKVQRIEIGTGEPVRDGARIGRLFADRLAVLADECDPGFGFDVVRLSALAVERLDPAQVGLDQTDHSHELAHLIDRLSARFGSQRLLRLLAQDTHIPEFAVTAVPAQTMNRQSARSSSLIPEDDCHWQDSLSPVRPIRLFEHPEPVEAIAEVPDGPPVRFRWRRMLHEVAHVEGPERIAMQWWRDEKGRTLTRDYFRVESREGARVWLYREGLYGRGGARPRWFLHGLFA
jgi:protein ImuB